MIALCGLILGVGGSIVDLLDVTSGLLDAVGVTLSYILGFALVAIAPLSLLALPACLSNKPLVAQNLLVWTFIGTLWFSSGELDSLVTIVFSGYALTVLAFWLKEVAGKRPPDRAP